MGSREMNVQFQHHKPMWNSILEITRGESIMLKYGGWLLVSRPQSLSILNMLKKIQTWFHILANTNVSPAAIACTNITGRCSYCHTPDDFIQISWTLGEKGLIVANAHVMYVCPFIVDTIIRNKFHEIFGSTKSIDNIYIYE